MKKILQTLAIALLLPLASMAQNNLTVTGIVTDSDGPIANAIIVITGGGSPVFPGEFIDSVTTDEDGLFTSESSLETAYEMITVTSDSCGYYSTFAIDEYPSTLNLQIDCQNNSGGGGGNEDCNALFVALPDSIEDGILYFYNFSTGDDLSYEWTFGDGTPISTEQFPSHDYADDEIDYEVCLYVYNSTCSDTLCTTISGLMDGNATGSGLVGGGGNTNGHNSQQGLAKTDGFQFVVLDGSTVLSTKQEFNEIELTVYPNPSTGIVNLKLDLPSTETGVITVTDLTGKVIFQEGSISNENVTLDMTSIPSGIYLVQFRGTESIAVRKIVIQ